jgi:hypothetical protein
LERERERERERVVVVVGGYTDNITNIYFSPHHHNTYVLTIFGAV